MMPLKPAKVEALRNFVILDGQAILSGLAALDGGSIDEILTKTTASKESEFGGQLRVGPAKGKAGNNRGRKVEEELRRRRTEHSAAAALIDQLEEMEAVGVVEGTLDSEVVSQLNPGDAIRVQGEIVLHPLHQADAILPNFIEVAPALDQKEAARDLRRVLPVWDILTGRGKTSQVLFEMCTTEAQAPRVIISARRTALQVEVGGVCGFGSMLAKVDRIVDPDDHVLAVRVLNDAPVSDLERGAIKESTDGIVEMMPDLGIEFREDDVAMSGPLVLLRPLCIWR